MVDPPIELADPERRLVLAYVPAARRPAVAALWALDEALARVAVSAREPAIGQIKLAWWRDALARLDSAPPPGEPLLQALATHALPAGVTGADMAQITEGWDALLPMDAVDEAALALYAEDRGERLFALTGTLLGGAPPTGAGAVWAIADVGRILRGSGARPVSPSIGIARLPKWPVPLRPLGMLYTLALRDSDERAGSPARVLAMLRHRLTGR